MTVETLFSAAARKNEVTHSLTPMRRFFSRITPGTIDADYRGEIGIILINHGAEPFVIRSGERIAQMVVAPVVQAELVEVEELDDTRRGAGGFGHTGR